MKIYLGFILTFIFILAFGEENYYSILEVPSKTNNAAQIEANYKRLSKKYSPEKNPGNIEAARRFYLIRKAYEVLSSQEKKKVYDHYGAGGVEQYERQGSSEFWNNSPRGSDAFAEVALPLEDFYKGTSLKRSVNRHVVCKKCKGTGAKDGKLTTCPKCHGRGVVLQNMQVGPGFTMQMQTTCDMCGGRGSSYKNKCPHCRGKKVVMEEKELLVKIEKGMREGEQIVFKGAAEQHPSQRTGDVVFTLKQLDHPTFTRVGDHLYAEIEINLKESLLGFTRKISHLDGHQVRISADGITEPFSVRTIKNEGMPLKSNPKKFGNLYFTFKVKLPTSISSNDLNELESILNDADS